MRKILSSSTAIAIGITFLMSPAIAQVTIADSEAEILANERGARSPHLVQALTQEIDGGLTIVDLVCLDPECSLYATPGGVAVQISESGQVFLADHAVQETLSAHMTGGVATNGMPGAQTQTTIIQDNSQQVGTDSLAEALAANEMPEPQTGGFITQEAPAPDLQEAPIVIEATDPVIPEAPEPTMPESPTQDPDVPTAYVTGAGQPGGLVPRVENPPVNTIETVSEPDPVPQPEQVEPAETAPTADPVATTEPAPAAEPALPSDQIMAPVDDPALSQGASDTAETVSQDTAIVSSETTANVTVIQEGASSTDQPVADQPAVAPVSEDELQAALADSSPDLPVYGSSEASSVVAVDVPEIHSGDTLIAHEAAEGATVSVTALETRPTEDVPAVTITENQYREAYAERDGFARAAIAGLAGFVVGQTVGENRRVAMNTGDRVIVVLPDGTQQVMRDDNIALMRPGSQVQTWNYEDGSSRVVIRREDGSQVITLRDRNMRTIQRILVRPDGTEIRMIDDSTAAPVRVEALPAPANPVFLVHGENNTETVTRALTYTPVIDRSFTLYQIRNIPEVRALVAPIEMRDITFDTGSAVIRPEQAQNLAILGNTIKQMVDANPAEMFLIEGHTDTVGSDAMNLTLSDRRAESMARALTDYFGIPPENMVVQGYGEQFLRVPVAGDVRENRRVSIRRITPLLALR